MTLYVLDTDILTLLQLKDPQVCERVAAYSPEHLAVTVISVEEQLSGWYTRLRRAKQRAELARVYQRLADNVKALSDLTILSFTEEGIMRYEAFKALKPGRTHFDYESFSSRCRRYSSLQPAVLRLHFTPALTRVS